jgi:hypothetical protein
MYHFILRVARNLAIPDPPEISLKHSQAAKVSFSVLKVRPFALQDFSFSILSDSQVIEERQALRS